MIGGVSGRRNEFPHICSVQSFLPIIGAQHICGSNVLSTRWVVTAASCLERGPIPIIGRREIVCGRLNLGLPNEPTEQRVQIASTILHPDYLGGPRSPNDIAMVGCVAVTVYQFIPIFPQLP